MYKLEMHSSNILSWDRRLSIYYDFDSYIKTVKIYECDYLKSKNYITEGEANKLNCVLSCSVINYSTTEAGRELSIIMSCTSAFEVCKYIPYEITVLIDELDSINVETSQIFSILFDEVDALLHDTYSNRIDDTVLITHSAVHAHATKFICLENIEHERNLYVYQRLFEPIVNLVKRDTKNEIINKINLL